MPTLHFVHFLKVKYCNELVSYFLCKMVHGVCEPECFRRAPVAVEGNYEAGDSHVMPYSLLDRRLCSGLSKCVSLVMCNEFDSPAAYVYFLFSTHPCFFCLLPTPLKVTFSAHLTFNFSVLLRILLILQ